MHPIAFAKIYQGIHLDQAKSYPSTLANPHTKFSGACPPYRTQFFHFHIHFHQKVPTSEVHAPPTGNPGSAPALGYEMRGFRLAGTPKTW